MDAMQILVIILSIFLAIFLVLGIVLITLLIKVSLQIKKVTGTAQAAAEHIESFAANASRVSSPAVIAKFVFKQIKRFRK